MCSVAWTQGYLCPHYIEPHSVWLQLISINACCQMSFRPIWCWQISLVLFLMRCAFLLHDNKKDTRCTMVTPTCISSRIFVCALRSRAALLCAQMMHTKSSQCATCTLLHYVEWNIWCEVSHSQQNVNLTLRVNLSVYRNREPTKGSVFLCLAIFEQECIIFSIFTNKISYKREIRTWCFRKYMWYSMDACNNFQKSPICKIVRQK